MFVRVGFPREPRSGPRSDMKRAVTTTPVSKGPTPFLGVSEVAGRGCDTPTPRPSTRSPVSGSDPESSRHSLGLRHTGTRSVHSRDSDSKGTTLITFLVVCHAPFRGSHEYLPLVPTPQVLRWTWEGRGVRAEPPSTLDSRPGTSTGKRTRRQ